MAGTDVGADDAVAQLREPDELRPDPARDVGNVSRAGVPAAQQPVQGHSLRSDCTGPVRIKSVVTVRQAVIKLLSRHMETLGLRSGPDLPGPPQRLLVPR